MGFRKSLKKLIAGAVAGGAEGEGEAAPATRWEKACTAMDGIAQQVAKIDPDGIDVYCFPGASGAVDRYQNVIDADAVQRMVAAHEPAGPCSMAQALSMAFADVQAKGGAKPTSMLVITAGQPDDKEAVISSMTAAIREQHENLSITFVHVGDDAEAEAFLKHVDENLTTTGAMGGEVDIVDTVKDEDIRMAMDEMRDPSFKAGIAVGALLGAFAGMAVGAGGAYLLAKHQAEKRTAGWNGTWEVITQPGDVATGVVLKVLDDMNGKLAIEGYPEDGSLGAPTVEAHYSESAESYAISREVPEGAHSVSCSNGCGRKPFGKYPTCCTHCKGPEGPHARDCKNKCPKVPGTNIIGNVVDEHYIEWSDNTAWREVPPEGASWGALAGAGAVGAVAGGAAGGAIGRLTQKKFFNKAASKNPCDYVIVVDRSAKMQAIDHGPGHK